ncbi:MAG: zf-HC2 domain-containing protein [Endomicrobiia bacterium]
MKCKKYKILISKYFDNELSQNQKDIILNHLSVCNKCREDFEFFSKIQTILQPTTLETSPHFEAKLLNKLKQTQIKPVLLLPAKYFRYLVPALGVIFITVSIFLTKLYQSKKQTFTYELYPQETIDLVMFEYYTVFRPK